MFLFMQAAGPGSPGVPSLEVCTRATQPALAVAVGGFGVTGFGVTAGFVGQLR